jgi:hypothetical protein
MTLREVRGKILASRFSYEQVLKEYKWLCREQKEGHVTFVWRWNIPDSSSYHYRTYISDAPDWIYDFGRDDLYFHIRSLRLYADALFIRENSRRIVSDYREGLHEMLRCMNKWFRYAKKRDIYG